MMEGNWSDRAESEWMGGVRRIHMSALDMSSSLVIDSYTGE